MSWRTNNIYILSQPIRSGKTTMLKYWLEKQPHVAGILTPDVDGKRKLLDITTNTYYDFETEASDHTLAVGRFHFDKRTFAIAGKILKKAVAVKVGWLIIDEIGKLEVERNEGLEPALSTLIGEFKMQQERDPKLLLVIRDSLLAAAIKKYNLDEAIIVDTNFFI